MIPTTLDRQASAEPDRLIDKGLDAVRDLSHEARVLKSAAADAIENGMHTARRSAKTFRRDAVDFRDEVTYRVKREPIKAMAFGAGALTGLLVAACWGARRF
jgi:hypothetical protein